MDSAPAATPVATDSGATTGATEQPQETKKAVTTPTQPPENGDTSVTSPPKQGEPTATPKPKYKLKARDREIEVDDEQIRHYAQRAFGLDQKVDALRQEAEEAKSIKAQLAELKNPETRRQALKQLLGADLQSVAEEELREQMALEQAESQMTEKEKALYRHLQSQQQQIDQFHQREQAIQKQREDARKQYAFEGIKQQVLTTTAEAIDSLKFPPSLRPAMARRMMPHIEAAIDQQVQLEPGALATFAVQEMKEEFGSVANELDGEGLYNWFGEAVAKKLLRYSIDKMKGRTNATLPPQQGQPSVASPPRQTSERRSIDDMLKHSTYKPEEAWSKWGR